MLVFHLRNLDRNHWCYDGINFPSLVSNRTKAEATEMYPHASIDHAVIMFTATKIYGTPTRGLGEYVKVAAVNAETIEDAYRLSQNTRTKWTENTEVQKLVPAAEDLRSTSVGDIIAAPSGIYVILPAGVAHLNFSKGYENSLKDEVPVE